MIIACWLIPAYSALCSLPPEAHDQCVTPNMISTWSVTWWMHDKPGDQCMINYVIIAWWATWAVHDSHVISAWSVTWSVHDQPRNLCMIATWWVHTITWAVHVQSRDQCMRATWSVHDQSRDRYVISHVNSACSVTWSGPAELRDYCLLICLTISSWAARFLPVISLTIATCAA